MMLDQCHRCGGIWFDGLELYRANEHAAKDIELLDAKALRNPTSSAGGTKRCPLDQTPLCKFSDPQFPESIQIESCPVCQGFWLNRGEFTAFQKEREEKRKEREETENVQKQKNDQLEKELQKFISINRSPNALNTLGRLGTFLSQPVHAGEQNYQRNFSDASTLTYIFYTIVRILLKIVLRV